MTDKVLRMWQSLNQCSSANDTMVDMTRMTYQFIQQISVGSNMFTYSRKKICNGWYSQF